MDKIHIFVDKLESAQTLPKGTHVLFSVDDILNLCTLAQQSFERDPINLSLKPPITVCGDLHGQFYDFLNYFKSHSILETKSYLFLGGYVNHGQNSLELIIYLFALKVLYPTKLFLLRGHHESRDVSKKLGFFDECINQYGAEDGEKIWNAFNDVFLYLPITAVIFDRIFCVHSGLSKELDDISKIEQLKRPIEIGQEGLAFDLLWARPDSNNDGWTKNDQEISFCYGQDIVKDFLEHHDFDIICRGHKIKPKGNFENDEVLNFYPNYDVMTLISVPNEETSEKGVVLDIDEELVSNLTFL